MVEWILESTIYPYRQGVERTFHEPSFNGKRITGIRETLRKMPSFRGRAPVGRRTFSGHYPYRDNGEKSIELAQEILNRKEKSLLNLYSLSVKELKGIPGIGKVKAVQLKCLAEITDRKSVV